MASQGEAESELRARLRRWLRYYRKKYRVSHRSDDAFAEALGISAPTLSTYLSGSRTSFGLDVMVRMHTSLHADLNDLVDTEPPEQVEGESPPPRAASSTAASARKRSARGGKL